MIASALTTMLLCGTAGLAGCESLPSLEALTRNLDTPQARVVDGRLQDLTAESATLVFDVMIDNPYDAALPLSDLSYAISSEGRSFLAGEAPVAGTIPARSSRTIEVPAELRFADVLSTLRSVRPGAVVPYTADLELSVDAPGVGPIALPVQRSGEVPVPAVPVVNLERVAWEELSLDRAVARFDLSVVNPNAFRVGLARLDYDLSLAGAPVARTGLDTTTSIDAGGTGTLSVPIEFSPSRLGGALLNLLTGDDATYAIAGTFDVDTPFGPVSLPFERSGRTEFQR